MPLGGLVARQPVAKYLDYYQKCQYWPRDYAEEMRNEALRETINIAYAEVPFYRRLYQEHGATPADIRSVDDLPKLPVVTKDMLVAAYPDECTRATGLPLNELSTSGSTGRPFRSLVDSDTHARTRALMFMRAMMAGYRPGDPIVQTGVDTARRGLKRIKDRLLAVSYVPTDDMSDAALDRALAMMRRSKARFIMGLAQSLYLIAARAKERGFEHSLTAAVSWGSLLLPLHRRIIREAFGCATFDTYGISEGMQIAAQCPADHGEFHIFDQHVAVEFCRDGQPVPTGETGDILLTRLNPGAMPYIRYKVGDLGAASSRECCSCGRTTPLMSSLTGRTADIVHTPGGNRLTVHFFSHHIGKIPGIRSFQVHQNAIDKIHLQIATDPEVTDDDLASVIDRLIQHGDNGLEISFERVSEIGLEKSGKQKYIISNLEGPGA